VKASATKTDKLDRILSTEGELVPSSGFAASVMDRVREEAAAPKPIPFPWKRALPGMTLAAVGLGWCAVKLAQVGVADMSALSSARLHLDAGMMRSVESAGWVAAALGVSLLSWLLARRMIGRTGLV
jgi:hypothetical protein